MWTFSKMPRFIEARKFLRFPTRLQRMCSGDVASKATILSYSAWWLWPSLPEW